MAPEFKPRPALASATVINDALIIAGQMMKELQKNGHITPRFEAQMVAQLNAVLYTLAFALPPGAMPITMEDTGDVISTCKDVAISKGKKKT